MSKKDVKVKSVAKKGYFDDRFKAIIKLHEEKLAKGGKE
tara:strand:+ start:267 stop:383 length:117 start_codon:yes stop_codon:yes gene_type:complete